VNRTYQVLKEYKEYPCNFISECTLNLPKVCNHFPSSSSLSRSVGTNNPFSGISTAFSFPFEDEVDRTLNDLVGEWEDWDWRDGTDDIEVVGRIGRDILGLCL
jgi:hypothetical protein